MLSYFGDAFGVFGGGSWNVLGGLWEAWWRCLEGFRGMFGESRENLGVTNLDN